MRVSIHAPVRGATVSPLMPQCSCGRFPASIAIPRGGIPLSRLLRYSFEAGQASGTIHAPVRGATVSSGVEIMTILRGFNPRARTGRDRDSSSHADSFNPRARTGRDRSSIAIPRGGIPLSRAPTIFLRRTSDVSIHAPVRGATERSGVVSGRDVSIHAPVRGATVSPLMPQCSCGRFPASIAIPRGGIPLSRLLRYSFEAGQASGTIHAPVRGATLSPEAPSQVRGHVSIHAPVRGATAGLDRYPSRPRRFQSTRPYGARRHARPMRHMSSVEFQSTRPYGARPCSRMPDACRDKWFQSTRPYGARRTRARLAPFHDGRFNPRARTGRDRAVSWHCVPRHRFNPRARTGRDAYCLQRRAGWTGFNPRARTGRDCGSGSDVQR